MRRNWIKLWVDQCLRGSLIEELTPVQRWLWVGLLLMAGDSAIPGIIYRRLDDKHEPVGFSDITIAELLDVPLLELQAGLKRLVETDKIIINEKGVITIRNWKKYQSEYSRQEPYRKDSNESYKESCNQSYKNNCNESYETELDIERDIEREEDKDTKGECEGGKNKSTSKKQEATSQKVEDASQKLIGDIIAKWNSFSQEHGLAKVDFIKPGTTRYQKLRARLKEKEFDFDAILKEIERSDFLKGASSNWRVTFDWIICPNNYPKVLEGQYKSKYYSSMDELEAWAKDDKNEKH